MTLHLRPTPLAELTRERDAHFVRLGQCPDLYLELMLPSAAAHSLFWRGQRVGYCIVTADRALLELELAPAAWSDAERVLAELWAALGLESALCLSFDALLLGASLRQGLEPTIVGRLFRDLADEDGPSPRPDLTLRPARPGDGSAIALHRDGVFEPEEDVNEYIESGRVHVLEGSGTFLGIGLVTPIWATLPERDVGVMVAPEHRGRGFATFILRSLKRLCLDQGLRPTAGCAADNAASQAALRHAGFASRYDLLQFARPGAR